MDDASGSVPQITAEEAIERANEGALLVDVREQWEWDAGHAPQATHIAMREFGDHIGELPTDQDVLIICQIGGRSIAVATALVDAGYRAVDVLGGMLAWEQAGGVVVRPAPPEPLA